MSLLQDATIRAQIHTDIQAAWTDVTRIQDGPPILPNKASHLPMAFVELGDVPFEYGQYGVKDITGLYTYSITRLAAWPTSGPIDTEKVTQANALLDIIMGHAALRYAGFPRQLKQVSFTADKLESGEPVYYITIDLAVEVTGNA